jgi:hypothetical protein
LKVLFIKRKFLLFILLASMSGLGFWLGCISKLQTVFIPQKSEVAIVIDDFEGRAGGIEEIRALPYPLTFAMMPFEEFSSQQAEQAMKKGFEKLSYICLLEPSTLIPVGTARIISPPLPRRLRLKS